MPRTRPVRSSASKLITTYTGFAGGFVSAKAVHELADDEFGGGQNVDLDRAGKASKRSGWKQMTAGSLAADGFKGAHEFRDNRGNALFFVAPYMTSSGMALYRLKDDESGWKPVRVALRGPVGVSAALAGGAGGAQFTASGHYLYAVAAESSNANYANSQPAEAAYIQQANPVEQITVTWKALRYAETYRVYRYNSARGWERFDSLVTGTSLTDTGALAVTVADPSTLPADRFAQLPGAASFAAAQDVAFATFFNSAVFADGRSLYRYGEYGTDLLPTQWQDFESSIPISDIFTNVAGGTVAYSTSIAYTGTKSAKITTAASGDGVEIKWPLKGGIASGEIVRAKGRYISLDASKAKQVTVQVAILDSGGAVLESSSSTLTPQLVWQEFDVPHTVSTGSGASVRVRITQATADAAEVHLDDCHLPVDAAEVLRPYVPTAAEVTNPGDNLLLTASNPIWTCRKVTTHANRLWLFDQPADPTYGYFSDTFQADYVPAPYIAKTETKQDDRVTAALDHRERLIVFTRDTVQRITGSDPSTFASTLVNDKVGCLAPLSVVGVDNYLTWVGRDGIYLARTVEGIQDYLDVVRISDPIQPTFDALTDEANAVAIHHGGQYKVHFPADGKSLRWYKPGVIKARSGVWTAPDVSTLQFARFVQRRDGKLYAVAKNSGKVFYLTPNNIQDNTSSYRDDGAAITFKLSKEFSLGDPAKPKDVYKLLVQSDYNRWFGQQLAVQVKAQTTNYQLMTKTLSFAYPAVDVNSTNMPSPWDEEAVDLTGYTFSLEFSNATLDHVAIIYALAFIHRFLRGGDVDG